MKNIIFLALAVASWSWCLYLIGQDTADCPALEATEPEGNCEQIVGTALSTTRVYRCYDPAIDICYLVSSGGGILEIDCTPHPILTSNPYE
jgi:hypothetical protein